MKKKTIRNLLITATAVTMTAGIALAVLPLSSALSVSGEEWTGVELQEEYLCGSTLTVPSRTVTADGKTGTATSVITFPDGTTTRRTDAVLDMTGRYTLTYTAMIDGKIYRTVESFSVYNTVARVGELSSVVYEKHALSASTEGLSVRLAQGDTLQFNTIIDVREVTANDPLVEVFVTPDRAGVMDFNRMIFTFTDAEDPDCYLKVCGTQSSDGINYPYTYFLAGGDNQPLEGWEQNWGKLHINNEWGSPAPHSFYGYYNNGLATLDHTKMSIRYDASSNSAYTGPNFIIDMDSSDYFTRLWSGFKSGKVRLSITADGYSATTANFVVSYVKDTDLSASRLEDTDPPVLTVQKPAGEMPVAKVGTGYPIPAATAKDDYSGTCAVTTSVFYNYSSSNPLTVTVKDGKFTPTSAGRYAIVYRTVDHEGNAAEEVLWVNASNTVPALELSVSSEDRVTSTVAGTLVTLPHATVSGGTGEHSLSIKAMLGGEELEIEDGAFRPRAVGTCTVTYTATDYIGQTATESYEITVGKGDKPVFEKDPVLPIYFLSGSEYEIPALAASDYTSGSFVERTATLSVTDKDGERQVSGKFTPVVEHNGDMVTLTFRAGNATLVRQVKTVLPMIQDGERVRLKMENYLVSDDATYVSGDESITVTAASANTGWTFANKLVAEGFTLNLRALSNKSQFGGLKITLTDSEDHSIAAEAELVYDGSTSLRANGTTIAISSGFQAAAQNKLFEFVYENGEVCIGAARIRITQTKYGKPFAGFPSDYVYLTVSFVDASAGAAYELMNINGQPMSAASSDRIRPKIAVLGSYGGVAEVGGKVTVRRAVAGDVLDPFCSFTLTVTDAEGNPVTDQNGVLLKDVSPNKEYVFEAKTYGQHFVSYTATDSFNGRPQTFGYTVIVEDRELPSVEFDREFITEIKTGEVIVIPDYTVSDNVTEAEKLIVRQYVVTASGAINVLPEDSNAFRPTGAGEYRIVITVLDEAGNLAVIEKTFTVIA